MPQDPNTRISFDEIQLFRFTDFADTADGGKLKFETKTLSLDDYNDRYAQYLSQHADTQHLPRQMFKSWIDCNRNNTGNQRGSDLCQTFPSEYFPRYRWGDFVAISYTWGERSDQRTVSVDGKDILISRNLENALRASGRLLANQTITYQLYLWNDCMCIDQTSEASVNLGMKQFSSVFATAYAVHIWVGVEAHESIKVLGLTKEIDRSWKWLKTHVAQRATLKDGLLSAMQVYGPVFPDLLLAAAEHGKMNANSIQRSIARLRYIVELRWTSSRNLPVDLGRVIEVSRASLQEQLVDKVYGLMGLMPPAVIARIDVDRAKSPARVCADMTKAFLEASSDLQIPRFCGGEELSLVPSWGVNLFGSRVSTSNLNNSIIFSAGGFSKSDVTPLGEDRLLIRGYIVDTVHTTTVSCAPDPRSSASSDTTAQNRPVSIYKDVLQLKHALWTTLVANQAYHAFSDNIEPQKVLLDVSWTFPLSSPELGLKAATSTSANIWTDQLDAFRFGTRDFDIFGHTLSSLFSESHDDNLNWPVVKTSILQMNRTLELRRLMTTAGGRLGICPEGVTAGDSPVVFPGCSDPLAISKVSLLGGGVDEYRLIGPCYVHGFMRGEAFQGGYELEDIVLV